MACAVPPVTVLVVDDNETNVRLIERIVRLHADAALLTAPDAGAGLELAARHHPDLVLLDINLPDRHGVDVLRHLRADPATASTPVVICTGDASPALRRACFEAGAAAYLTKPFELSEVSEIIEQARLGTLTAVASDAPRR
jgi:CheY-like chemotaxis protein